MVAGSEFIGAALIQDPDSLTWFAGHGDPAAARAANEEYEIRAGGAATPGEAEQVLREWRRREMLRIAWRDMAGRRT